MSFIKTPTKGMRDFLPKEMALREYVLKLIKETYELFGFEQIGTPSVEHIENLLSKQGGENEKLIFKILKRGERLEKAINDNEDLVDSGLRYDLTVPLARMYANNMQNLSFPFRSLQIGYSYRAERPQRGRYRELMQCDLDILGEKSNLAEIELITAVVTFLKKLQFKDFVIKINDRRILKAMIEYADMSKEKMDLILIAIDKLDKIGISGVEKELENIGILKEQINKYLDLFKREFNLQTFVKDLPVAKEVVDNLEDIILSVKENVNVSIVFDPTLVRGMGYYTGTIFEIYAEGLSSAIGGGGRYDEMIGNYTNMPVSACGFSIGFERLVLLLMERGFNIPNDKEKLCYLISNDDVKKKVVLKESYKQRLEGKIVKIAYKNKNVKYQIEQLEKDGYKVII